jgi:ribosome-associated heat shock protein Hsp15
VASKKPPQAAQDDASDDETPAGGPSHRFAPASGLRIDKWLWCTRFFKTRALAQEAVDGGHVQIDGARIKASRHVRIGDRLRIHRGAELFEIDVTGIPERRGPGAEARLHYRETPESETARAHVRELNRLSGPVSGSRPDKRDRRNLMRFVKGRGRSTGEAPDDFAAGRPADDDADVDA